MFIQGRNPICARAVALFALCVASPALPVLADGGSSEHARDSAAPDSVREELRDSMIRVLLADPPSDGRPTTDRIIDDVMRGGGGADEVLGGGAHEEDQAGRLDLTASGHAYAGSGLVDVRGLREAVRERTPAMGACLAEAERAGTADEGSFGVAVTFSEQGLVLGVAVVGPPGSVDGAPLPPSVRGAAFGSCVRDEVRNWAVARHVPGSGTGGAAGRAGEPAMALGAAGPAHQNTNQFTQYYDVERRPSSASVSPVARCGPAHNVRCAVVDDGAPQPSRPGPATRVRLQLDADASNVGEDERTDRVVRRGELRLQTCFRRHDPSAEQAGEGHMVARLTIDASGRVEAVQLRFGADRSAVESELVECLEREMTRWRFAASDAESVTLTAVWRVSVPR